MSEDQNQPQTKEQQENQKLQDPNERELRHPRDVTNRPPSKAAKSAPAHERLHGHGIRTTATQAPEEVGSLISEIQRENFKLAEQEDFEASTTRNTGAGPNPYRIPTSREAAGEKGIKKLLKDRDKNELHNSLLSEQALATYQASIAESDAADAEVAVPGETLTDTGAKIQLNPERVAADDKAVLERKDFTHAEAIKEYEENAQEEGYFGDYRVAVAHAEATAEADEDALTADKNPGALYGEDARNSEAKESS